MKLLVIEDDLAIASGVRRGLEAEGFTVDVVHDGDQGLWQATEGTYDLVVLDVMLPGRNGYRVCADLRSRGVWTPILMLTAKSGDLDEAEGLDTGADDYLTKPFSFPVLVARVRALTRRQRSAPPPPLELQGVKVDPMSRRAWTGEAEVSLTARELDVLAFLLRHPGQVVSKGDVLDGVWSHEFEGDPNIVEVYVGRLRRKLGARGDALLETVRGAGYRVADRG